MNVDNMCITLPEIQLVGYHGVLEQERKIGNEFAVALTIYYDAEMAAITDHLGQALNYAEIVNVVRDVNKLPSALLENFAFRIAHALLEAFPTIDKGTVTVTKLHAPIAGRAGKISFSLEFSRD